MVPDSSCLYQKGLRKPWNFACNLLIMLSYFRHKCHLASFHRCTQGRDRIHGLFFLTLQARAVAAPHIDNTINMLQRKICVVFSSRSTWTTSHSTLNIISQVCSFLACHKPSTVVGPYKKEPHSAIHNCSAYLM